MSRAQLKELYQDLTWPGLEFGPSYHPLFKKSDGYNIEIVDYKSQDDLKKFYEPQNIDTSQIEHVDYLWKGESLNDLIPKKYKIITANHLLEHLPNLIGFLTECENLLEDDGLFIISLPDKRLCFDYFRQNTSLAQLIDASMRGDIKPTYGAIVEHIFYATKRNNSISWGFDYERSNFEFVHEIPNARHAAERSATDFIDVHSWVFTPSTFREIINSLNLLGYTTFNVFKEYPPSGCEFYSVLKKGMTGRLREDMRNF